MGKFKTCFPIKKEGGKTERVNYQYRKTKGRQKKQKDSVMTESERQRWGKYSTFLTVKVISKGKKSTFLPLLKIG